MDSPSPEQTPSGPDGPPRRSGDSRSSFPSSLLVIFVVVMLVGLVFNSARDFGSSKKVPYNFFLLQLRKNNVSEVTATGSHVVGKWRELPADPDDETGKARLPDKFEVELAVFNREDPELVELLKKHNVKQDAEPNDIGFGAQLLIWLIPPIILVGFFFFIMRRNSDPMGSGFLGNFSRSPARQFQSSDQKTTFKDVAAMEQAKSELMEVVEFLKAPAKFQRLGAQIPKGVLLIGQPGTGKTLLSRATAGEAGVPFYSINGSEFIQMFVGVGASRVRDLFHTAKDNAPCIIFIDEIDAVGRHRGAGLGGGHDEREQTLNQILSEMDGFEQTASVIVLAATNRPDVLDPALLRPGRFDRHITIDRPTKDGRAAILKVHSRKVPLGDDVDLKEVAAGTTGFSGAELKNLVNEAALLAVRAERNAVMSEDFDAAFDRVLMGPRREEVLNLRERRLTAYHEAGHALLGWVQPEVDAVHKVTIIPRGRALGVTQFQPDEERFHVGERTMHAQLAMMLAGRAAEKLVFDEYSAGAEDDIKRATRLARGMVAHWGMSDAVGPVAFRQGEEHPFLGKEMHESREFSEETAHLIDLEIGKILRSAQEDATRVLRERRADLDRIADALLEKELLDRNDLTELLGPAAKLPEDDAEPNPAVAEVSTKSVAAVSTESVAAAPSTESAAAAIATKSAAAAPSTKSTAVVPSTKSAAAAPSTESAASPSVEPLTADNDSGVAGTLDETCFRERRPGIDQ